MSDRHISLPLTMVSLATKAKTVESQMSLELQQMAGPVGIGLLHPDGPLNR